MGDWSAYSGDALSGGGSGPLTAFNETRQHNDAHEILEIDDGTITPLAHDAKGNLTLDEEGNTYTWDFDNRLKEVRDSNGDLLASYTYDALGRRTTKTVPGTAGGPSTTTAFVHLTDDSGMGQLLAEYEDNALKRQYTYGVYIDEPITLTRHDAGLPGGEETLYYHRDRQYNVIGLTSGGGAVVERYAYGPYGERRVLAPDGTTIRQVSAYGNPLGHQGLYHDDETGLVYNRARYRDAGLGRFLGRDPLEYIDGQSLYAHYAAMHFHIDPSGEVVWKIPIIIGGKIIAKAYKSRKAARLARQRLRQQQRNCNRMYRNYKDACGRTRSCSPEDCPDTLNAKIQKHRDCISGRQRFENGNCCHINQAYMRELKKPGRARSVAEMNRRAERCSRGHQQAIEDEEAGIKKCEGFK
ncbi:MAG: RHS repeat-associated core domain-containing protein [Planctomycetota bacterium]